MTIVIVNERARDADAEADVLPASAVSSASSTSTTTELRPACADDAALVDAPLRAALGAARRELRKPGDSLSRSARIGGKGPRAGQLVLVTLVLHTVAAAALTVAPRAVAHSKRGRGVGSVGAPTATEFAAASVAGIAPDVTAAQDVLQYAADACANLGLVADALDKPTAPAPASSVRGGGGGGFRFSMKRRVVSALRWLPANRRAAASVGAVAARKLAAPPSTIPAVAAAAPVVSPAAKTAKTTLVNLATATTPAGKAFQRGLACEDAGDLAGAAQHYSTAIAADAACTLCAPRTNLGVLLAKGGDSDGAATAFSAAVHAADHAGDCAGGALAHVNLGYLRELVGEHRSAMRSYRAALASHQPTAAASGAAAGLARARAAIKASNDASAATAALNDVGLVALAAA